MLINKNGGAGGWGWEGTKNQYRVGIAEKEGLGQFVDLRGGWGLGKKDGGGIFEGGIDTPIRTMKMLKQ